MSRNTLLEDMEDRILDRRDRRLNLAEALMKLGLLFGLAFFGFLAFNATVALVFAVISGGMLLLALILTSAARE